jgi:predicted DCC family thiol-disulfide oxidoreductase YuxK
MPAPETHRRTLIVVFDGGCGLCSAGSRWIRRLDWLGRCLPVPLQSESLYRLVPELTPAACWEAMQVVLPGGRVRSGGDAIRTLMANLPLTAPLALVLAVPPLPWLVRRLYPWLATRRRSLSAACGLSPRR